MLPANYAGLTVRDFWSDTGGWKLQYITPFITDYWKLRLLALVVDTINGRQDHISWGGSNDGKFTVKAAYEILTRDDHHQQQMGAFYDRIWTVKVQERVRVFLWLVSHQVIMTNMERLRRHLSSTGVCQVCRGGEETILHALRDCPSISGIWLRIVSPSQHDTFFNMSLLEWLYQNLGDAKEIRGCPWNSLFATTVWWSWKWRCGFVFGTLAQCRDRVRFVCDKAKETVEANQRMDAGNHRGERVERTISWLPPSQAWFKVNTDGASRGNPGMASAGGVLRDNTGAWCGGFALHIGICSAPMAELWGVYYGLNMAWGKGVTRLDLEVDSEIVVRFLTLGIEDTHPLSFLAHLCYGLISKDWEVRITHVYREANHLADGLANYAFSLPLGFHLFEHPPDCVSSFLVDDMNGVVYTRRVRM